MNFFNREDKGFSLGKYICIDELDKNMSVSYSAYKRYEMRNRMTKPECETCNKCYHEGYGDGQSDHAKWYHDRSKLLKNQIKRIRDLKLDSPMPIHELLLTVESLWKNPKRLLEVSKILVEEEAKTLPRAERIEI